MSGQPIGLNCPGCGEPPELLIGDRQAFCGNDDCRLLMWDPAKTLDEMLDEGVHEVDMRGWSQRDSNP